MLHVFPYDQVFPHDVTDLILSQVKIAIYASLTANLLLSALQGTFPV